MTGISDSVRIQSDGTACEQCGSTSRVGRGLCLNCLLLRCLGSDSENKSTLKRLLDEIEVRDADWRIGNYQILEEIGRGGMGVIYRARQRHSRRIVALKRMLSFQADSQETLARFRREAEAVASLDHPNILPIYEVSEGEDGLPFFSMKFAAGGSLLDAARALRNEPHRSVELMAKVARAVQYAHGHGILHRDLKPGNILLDGRGEPLVSDFGLAKWLDTTSDVTRTLTIFGTPGYIAPEQAKGSTASLAPAADVYSLGAILFDLFTGRPPFLGEHALAVIQQVSEKPAPKLRSLIPGFDRDLETVCAKCLEREPNARYRSAGDLAEDLERWLEGRPIKTRRVLPSTHAWRWSRRNPGLVGTAAVCLLLGAASVWHLRQPGWTRQTPAATEKFLLSGRADGATALHHYTFDGPGVVDSVGTANGMLLNGASVSSGRLDLDGIDDYVQFDQHIVPTVGDFSVAFFAQEISPQATHTEIISQGLSEAPGFYVGYDPSHNFRIGDDFRNPPGHLSTGVPFPSDGFLHHYAVTAGSDSRLYIDGSLVTTFGPMSMTPVGDDTRLGRQFDPYFEFFNGNLDDLWVFSGTLTAGEVASLVVAGSRERAKAAYLGKDYAEAERLFLTMAGAAQQAIPPKTVNIIEALCLAARSAQKLEEFIRAREHLAKAEKLTDRQRNPGEWAEGRAILAKNLWYQGRNAEAETLLQEVIRAHEKALGARVYLLKNNVTARVDELDTLTPLQCRTLFANTLRDQGKYAEAEAQYKEVIQLEENVLGPEHRDTLNACYNLAYQLGQEGKREQAKAFAERAAKSAANVLGVNDPHTREYAKFLEELESGHAITMPAVEFRKTFVSGNKAVEQGPR